jgi:transposase
MQVEGLGLDRDRDHGGADVAQVRSWAGLDVHAAKVIAASVDGASGELEFRRLSGATSEVVGFCRSLPGPVKVSYEAGPTGFGLAREFAAAGIECVVAAPGKIARAPQDRVKTDRRDAERLVRLLMAGELHAVRVPAVAEEALRDLVRAREDLRGDLMRARHRVGKLLLRHDVHFEGNNWTQAHREWLAGVRLAEPVAQAVIQDGVGAIDALVVRRDALERQMTALVPDSPWATEIARLRCLRGIDTLSALGLSAEIGDFARFGRPGRLMSYLGLVPSENTTGDKRRQGSITKSGSQHARRLLVEAAWHYRRAPRVGRELARRQDGQPQHITAISWHAQRRLHRTWQRLDHQRGKRRTIVAVAVARELAGFCWAVTTAN